MIRTRTKILSLRDRAQMVSKDLKCPTVQVQSSLKSQQDNLKINSNLLEASEEKFK